MADRPYYVALDGCDDSTHFILWATEDQAAFLRRVANLANEASEYGCQPGMSVHDERPSYWMGEDVGGAA